MNAQFRNAFKLKGFTLIELLTTVTIIGVLVALIFPAVSNVKKTALNVECIAKLRKLSAAFSLYSIDNNNSLPKTFSDQSGSTAASNWIFTMSGYQSNGIDYLGVKTGSSLITVGSKKPSPLICRKNVIDAGSDSANSASASTYAMNTAFSEFRIVKAQSPEKAMLCFESTSVGNKWSFTGSGGTRMNVSVHSGHGNVLYLDGHIDAITKIPPASNVEFWTP